MGVRTLVLAQNLPHPTFAGMDLRNWQNIHALARISEVGVFGLHSNDARVNHEPPLSLAFWRTSKDPALAYPPPAEKLQARGWLLDPGGHPSDLYYSEQATAEIDALVQSFKPDIAVLEGLWLHRYISLLKRRRCRVVIDFHAVETAMFGELGACSTGDDFKSKLRRDILPERVRTIERQAAHAADEIWLCSEEDRRLMKELHAPEAPLRVVPNTIDVDHYAAARADVVARRGSRTATARTVIFPALFQWEPNGRAAAFLIDEMFPLLARIFPDCRLLLAGASPTPAMISAAGRDPRIVVTGTVSDMRPSFAAADAMAVPLWQGGGTRLKILEGLAATIPVITTRKGAEGLAVQDGTQVLFAENGIQFVEAITRVWTEPELAERLAGDGLALLKRAYSWEVSSARIAEAVAELHAGECGGSVTRSTP